MPVVFGIMAPTVEDVVGVFERYGDRLRGTYRAQHRFDQNTSDLYAAPRLQRPDSLERNPPNAIFPWEQVFLGRRRVRRLGLPDAGRALRHSARR